MFIAAGYLSQANQRRDPLSSRPTWPLHLTLAAGSYDTKATHPGSKLELRYCASKSSYSRFVEVPKVLSTEPGGVFRLRSSPGVSSAVLRSLPIELMGDKHTSAEQ